MRQQIGRLSAAIAREQSDVRSQFARTQAALTISIRTQTAAALKQASEATQTEAVGISFAAPALGLVVASISHAHDSVMPLGVTVSMAMAAIGVCWWPLDFEPSANRTCVLGRCGVSVRESGQLRIFGGRVTRAASE